MKYMKVVLIILQWDYLLLVDNKKEEIFEYSIFVFIVIRLFCIMIVILFFILEGFNGFIDICILFDL